MCKNICFLFFENKTGTPKQYDSNLFCFFKKKNQMIRTVQTSTIDTTAVIGQSALNLSSRICYES